MNATCIQTGQPFDTATNEKLVEQFHRDGFLLVPGVLSQEECAALRDASDAIFADPALSEYHVHGIPYVKSLLFEADPVFRDLLVKEPIFSLVEAVLGPRFQCCGQNIIRNEPGDAIHWWHVDDTLENPLPDSIPRHDPRMRMPILWITVQVALTDIESEEYGPTQCVPGSHYAGRKPDGSDSPTFDGQGPVSMYCKAGDIYLQNHQCWHRGAPNRSDRTRYILQLQYGKAWLAARFVPPTGSRTPDWVFQDANERLTQVLGQQTRRA